MTRPLAVYRTKKEAIRAIRSEKDTPLGRIARKYDLPLVVRPLRLAREWFGVYLADQ